MADGSPVVFDTVVNDQSLTINYAAGVFTISAVGNYYVDWWVSIDGAGLSPIAAFAVQLNGSGDIIGASPVVTGQVTGNALITVGAAPATLSLVNVTGDTIFYGATPVQADIVITEVTV